MAGNGEWRVQPGFFKAHGHGNDYLVMERGDGWRASPEAIRLLCDRWRGVGSDGVVFVDPDTRPYELRMFNPDGGEFERSGNGLRVAAAFLRRRGWVDQEAFPVRVGGREVTLQVLGGGDDGTLDVRADMGRVEFGPVAVSMLGRGDLMGPDGEHLQPILVSVGNPHCVVFRDSVESVSEALPVLGPWIASHERFPKGVNVQVAAVQSDRLHIGIWERGVGRTSSSGTSACAATAAAVRSGRVPMGTHEVQMEGGCFEVSIDAEYVVQLRGPVQPVIEGALTSEWLAAL